MAAQVALTEEQAVAEYQIKQRLGARVGLAEAMMLSSITTENINTMTEALGRVGRWTQTHITDGRVGVNLALAPYVWFKFAMLSAQLRAQDSAVALAVQRARERLRGDREKLKTEPQYRNVFTPDNHREIDDLQTAVERPGDFRDRLRTTMTNIAVAIARSITIGKNLNWDNVAGPVTEVIAMAMETLAPAIDAAPPTDEQLRFVAGQLSIVTISTLIADTLAIFKPVKPVAAPARGGVPRSGGWRGGGGGGAPGGAGGGGRGGGGAGGRGQLPPRPQPQKRPFDGMQAFHNAGALAPRKRHPGRGRGQNTGN